MVSLQVHEEIQIVSEYFMDLVGVKKQIIVHANHYNFHDVTDA